MTSTSCAECGQVHERCSKHRTRRGPDGRKVPCGAKPVRGLDACYTHSGKRLEVAKAEGQRNLDRAEGERSVLHAAQQLGLEAEERPAEEWALWLLRRAVHAVAAYTVVVRELTDAAGGDLTVLGVHTGNEKKPNEVEDHWAYAQLKYWEREAFARAVDVRKLGIEEARLEQQERMAQADAERVIAVIRMTLDGLRADLLERGTERAVIEATYRESVPKLVAAAVRQTTEVPA